MKSMIIATVDALAYLAFVLVALIALVALMQGKALPAMGILVGGWIVCSLVFGAWFVLSDIADSARKIAERKQ